MLLILLVLTSLLTYLVRLLHRKMIKLHILCTVWNFRLFVSQHLDLSLIYSMISRLFSQLYSCWSINRFLSFILSTTNIIIIQWHKEEERMSKSNRIIIISQGVDILTFHLIVYIKMSIVTNKIDKWREKERWKTDFYPSIKTNIQYVYNTAKWINCMNIIRFLYFKMKRFASINFYWSLSFFFPLCWKVSLYESYFS